MNTTNQARKLITQQRNLLKNHKFNNYYNLFIIIITYYNKFVTGKEARKKELKETKKQRQLVRAAVLKGKDLAQIIEEMEKIDQMEYNVMQPPPLNEKVLKDKRKKLKETLDRILKMYAEDDQEMWAELKKTVNTI